MYDWTQAGQMLDGAALVVNTTSLGMVGKADFQVPLDALDRHAVVTDLVYTPLHTPLLIAAQARGCTTVDGLGMLLHQAAPALNAGSTIAPMWTRRRGRRSCPHDQARLHPWA